MNKVMRKVIVVAIVLSLAVVVQASVLHGTLTQTTHMYTAATDTRTAENCGMSNQDTLQTTELGLGKLLWEHYYWKHDSVPPGWATTTGPMWGGLTAQQAASDAGANWWEWGGNTTIGIDTGDGMLDIRWADSWGPWDANYQGRVLDRIDILVAGYNNSRPNYSFNIQHLNMDWTTFTPITDGFLTVSDNPVGTGTLISIRDINLAETRGIRIISNRLDQSIGGAVDWYGPSIQEIDVFLIPEPATMGLLGLGGILLRRRRA